MDGQKEKRLDELLTRAIDSSPVTFDAEKWRQEHPGAWQAIVSRKVVPSSAESLPRLSRYRKFGFLAAAAVAIVTIGVALVRHRPAEPVAVPVFTAREKTPAEMMSLVSLSMAYRRGGIEAVEEQCDKALKTLRRKTAVILTVELLNENNGT